MPRSPPNDADAWLLTNLKVLRTTIEDCPFGEPGVCVRSEAGESCICTLTTALANLYAMAIAKPRRRRKGRVSPNPRVSQPATAEKPARTRPRPRSP